MEIGTTIRQTTEKHQRCQQLDLLKEKGIQAMEAKSTEQKRRCGKGMGQVGWKQKPKQLSKAQMTTKPPLDLWDSCRDQGAHQTDHPT